MHVINASNISLQIDSTSRATAEKQVRTLLKDINEEIAGLEGNPAFFIDTHLDLSVENDGESTLGLDLRPRKLYGKAPAKEDTKFTRAMWQKEVAKGETLLGYWPWVEDEKAE